MPRIQAVIFDLDDTLYPERQYVRSGYAAVCEYLRDALGAEGPFEQFLWGRFCRGQVTGAFDDLNSTFKLDLSREEIAGLVNAYRTHRPNIQPYELMAGLLGLLHERYKLGLLSDGFLPAQKLKLEALKIERFFDAVVFTEQIGRDAWKPSPAGFERIAEMLAIAHPRCAYVSDNLSKDFVAPNKLGWLTVRYVQPEQVHSNRSAPPGGEPACVVSLPGELCQALLVE